MAPPCGPRGSQQLEQPSALDSSVLIAVDWIVQSSAGWGWGGEGLTVSGSYLIIREINKRHVQYYLNLGCDERERGRRVV